MRAKGNIILRGEKRGPKERRSGAERPKSGRVGEINKHILAQSAEGGGWVIF